MTGATVSVETLTRLDSMVKTVPEPTLAKFPSAFVKSMAGYVTIWNVAFTWYKSDFRG